MAHNSEPAWAQPLRQALSVAVDVVGDPASHESELVGSSLQRAISAGWRPPGDRYEDFWATARKISELNGSLKQHPLNAFLTREVERINSLQG